MCITGLNRYQTGGLVDHDKHDFPATAQDQGVFRNQKGLAAMTER
jgi:hypothetical protein